MHDYFLYKEITIFRHIATILSLSRKNIEKTTMFFRDKLRLRQNVLMFFRDRQRRVFLN